MMATIAHATNERRRDRFGIVGCLESSDIKMKVAFVNTSENSETVPQGSACPFAGVAMNFTSAIAVIITSPFVNRVADSMMVGMSAVI